MRRPAGRFAPSPTGPLHSGSLLAATASYLDARSRGERWLLRMDDLDTYRNAAGAERAILTALEAHGLLWDGPVSRQSRNIERYEAAIEILARGDLIYYCTCSRRELSGLTIYPGHCREKRTPDPDAAIRVRVDDHIVRFTDLCAGAQEEHLARTCGDIVIRRRDGIIAYQLATAVDDGAPGITRVVRGGDLLDNTARQMYLMQLLGLTPPVYAHLPILTGADGNKLSKQTLAPALDNTRPTANLLAILPCLEIHAPTEAAGWSPGELLDWATSRWAVERIPCRSLVFRH